MTTKKTRREFTNQFKREAVVLLRDSGRPLTRVAAKLGLEPSVLRRWRSRVNGAGQAPPAVRPGAAVAASAEPVEIRRLQKELERAQMERDIVKKRARIGCPPVAVETGSSMFGPRGAADNFLVDLTP